MIAPSFSILLTALQRTGNAGIVLIAKPSDFLDITAKSVIFALEIVEVEVVERTAGSRGALLHIV